MKAKKKHIVIINSQYGGITAAIEARQHLERAKITLIEPGDSIGSLESFKEEVDFLKTRYNIDLRLKTKPLSLDMDARCLLVEKEGMKERLGFDSLIYAGGVVSKKLGLKGLLGNRVLDGYFLNETTIKDIQSQDIKKVLIIGGGNSAITAACLLSKSGFETTLMHRSHRLAADFSMATSYVIRQELKKNNIDVKLGCEVKDVLSSANNGFVLQTSLSETFNADLVIYCIGIESQTKLLADAGAALDHEGFLRVDETLSTTLSNIYACGHVIALPKVFSKKPKWMILPFITKRTAQIAATNACFGNDEKETIKPFCDAQVIKINDFLFARTGLSEEEAKSIFSDENIFITTVFDDVDDDGNSAGQICIRLVVNKQTASILGAEISGKYGVERRIDLISGAILKNWSIDDLLNFDMVSGNKSLIYREALKEAAIRAKCFIEDKSKPISPQILALWFQQERDFRLINVSNEANILKNQKITPIHVPLSKMREKIKQIEAEKSPIVLYSKTGKSSYLAQQALRQLGIENVYYLDGGAFNVDLITQ